MLWENPSVLLLLWILPLVAGVLYHAHRRRVAAAGKFADPEMVARLMPPLRGPRPWVKGGLMLLGLACLIVAGARPRFGVYFEKVTQFLQRCTDVGTSGIGNGYDAIAIVNQNGIDTRVA